MTMLALAGTALSAAGTGLQAYQQYQAGEAAEEQAEYQSQIRQQQASIETEKLSKERRQLLGRQRAAFGKAGVQLSGSPLRTMEETASAVERDIQLIGHSARIGSQQDLYGGKLTSQRKKQQSYGTLLGGVGSAAGNAYSIYDTWG